MGVLKGVFLMAQALVIWYKLNTEGRLRTIRLHRVNHKQEDKGWRYFEEY